MTATDELRKLLDERGVAHSNHYLSTTWRDGHGILHLASQLADSLLVVDMLTPEQAIAEALGPDTCEMEYVSNCMRWHCKTCDQMDMAPRNPKPRYCKWCGRKVVGE